MTVVMTVVMTKWMIEEHGWERTGVPEWIHGIVGGVIESSERLNVRISYGVRM